MLIFSIIFLKTELFISLKKSFSNSFFASVLSLVFISIYGFNHASWLNWITLCTFFIRIHDSMLVLKLLCTLHVFLYLLYYKQVFLLFLIFFFQVKMVSLYDDSIIVLGTLYLIQENIQHHYYYITILHHNFL